MGSYVAPSNQIVRLGLATMVAMATFVASAKTCKAQNTGEEPRRFELRIENGRLTAGMNIVLGTSHNVLNS